ncbi:MAG TPA: 23S rRNA (adenine(2503)-C(2))-methyltransferase RlmN, partial [Candidatus Cloacimonadota bacterium]|nr:23S rRNA (adenine(2503)-C(2))-methyltransferase RlmN [Candidatus Cloacimonadota bacterium]
MLKHILSLSPDALATDLSAAFPAYRAKQVLAWIYARFTTDPDSMTDLPTEVKEHLKQNYRLELPEVDARLLSKDGTIKYRLKLADACLIEMVMIPEVKKKTLCISSQVGCSRACAFCATGKAGLTRNLFPEEIIGQFI